MRYPLFRLCAHCGRPTHVAHTPAEWCCPDAYRQYHRDYYHAHKDRINANTLKRNRSAQAQARLLADIARVRARREAREARRLAAIKPPHVPYLSRPEAIARWDSAMARSGRERLAALLRIDHSVRVRPGLMPPVECVRQEVEA